MLLILFGENLKTREKHLHQNSLHVYQVCVTIVVVVVVSVLAGLRHLHWLRLCATIVLRTCPLLSGLHFDSQRSLNAADFSADVHVYHHHLSVWGWFHSSSTGDACVLQICLLHVKLLVLSSCRRDVATVRNCITTTGQVVLTFNLVDNTGILQKMLNQLV